MTVLTVSHHNSSSLNDRTLSSFSFTEFDVCTSKVIAIRYQKGFHQEVSSGVECGILLDRTSFYAESGGQTYDEGFMTKIGDEVGKVFTTSPKLKE